MRIIAIIAFILLSFSGTSQKEIKLKRKYFGEYTGLIPAYRMDVGDEVIEVTSAPIYINIQKESITINIGQNSLHGTYTVMFKAQTYYLLDVKVDGQIANERILVYKRGKKISRDGLYPQPVTELDKD